MPDFESTYVTQLLSELRMGIVGKSKLSQPSYLKAVKNLEAFLRTYFNADSFPKESTLADWMVFMRQQGLSPKTALHYYDKVSSLYNKTSCAIASSTFQTFKEIIKEQIESSVDNFNNDLLNKVQRITKAASSQSNELSLATDILLYSLIYRGMPVADIAKLKTANVDRTDTEVAEIVRRQASPARKYLFDLNQSRLTARQLNAAVENKILNLFQHYDIPIAHSIDNTIKSIIAQCAIRCGMSGSEVLAILGKAPLEMTLLSSCSKAELEEATTTALYSTVKSWFFDNPRRWYPMKLRARVTYQEMQDHVRKYYDDKCPFEFFYPYDEIKKRIGKKLVTESVPVIKDIVFFRARVTDIFPLFCKIGDIAWCYTTTGKPGGDYAAIPRHQFERFQETIGQFTSDYEVAPIGGFEPEEGERVVVLSGLLADREFDVSKIEDGDNTVFQLRMIGDNGIQWRTRARKYQLKTTTAGCNG